MKLTIPRIPVPSVKLPRLVRSLWIRLPLAAIVLLLAFLGVQSSHHPASYKHAAQPTVTAKHQPKTQPQVLGASDVKPPTEDPQAAPAASPASPKQTRSNGVPSKVLSVDPAVVEIYRRPENPSIVIKSSASMYMAKSFLVRATDGQFIGSPSTSAPAGTISTPTLGSSQYRESQLLLANITFASVGTYDYTISAQSAAGVTYTGTVEVVLKTMPVFYVNAPVPLSASGSATSDDVTLYGFDQLQFDLSQVTGFMPTLTLTVAGYSCHTSLDAADSPACDSALDSVPAGNYTGSLVFENQFQVVTIPFSVNITP